MNFYQFPEWSGTFRNLYWQLRACRCRNKMRTIYRKIAKERDQLIERGIDAEWIRKLGLLLTTSDRSAQQRRRAAVEQYEADLAAWRTGK